MPKLNYKAFKTQKKGETPEDCQDSWAWQRFEKGNFVALAVSDGATESFLPAEWSAVLTANFAKSPVTNLEGWMPWLVRAQAEWLNLANRKAKGKQSYSLQNNLLQKKPAAATFVGLVVLNDDKKPQWQVLAKGDSCFFYLSGGMLMMSCPLQSSDEFGFSGVDAVLSYEDQSLPICTGVRTYSEGDVFILASDAISKWLLKRSELNKPVWGTLINDLTEENFADFVAKARHDSECPMDNDDVTVMILQVGVPSKALRSQTYNFQDMPPVPKQAMEIPLNLLPVPVQVSSSTSAVSVFSSRAPSQPDQLGAKKEQPPSSPPLSDITLMPTLPPLPPASSQPPPPPPKAGLITWLFRIIHVLALAGVVVVLLKLQEFGVRLQKIEADQDNRRNTRSTDPTKSGGASATAAQPDAKPGGASAPAAQPDAKPGGASAPAAQPDARPGGASAPAAQPDARPGGASAPAAQPDARPGGASASAAQPDARPGGASAPAAQPDANINPNSTLTKTTEKTSSSADKTKHSSSKSVHQAKK